MFFFVVVCGTTKRETIKGRGTNTELRISRRLR